MERKNFTLKSDNGESYVQFDLAFAEIKPIISNIIIYSSEKNLPRHPEIRNRDGELQFYQEYDTLNSNNMHVREHRYFNDKLSKTIIGKINEIADDSIPKFTD